MKKPIYLFAFLALLSAGCGKTDINTHPSPIGIACTQEAKLCPDGSYVARTGPNCEFTACPGESTSTPPAPVPLPISQTSGIQGTVTIGPTCPVQRIPPDPNCADKPYQATIKVMSSDGQKQITVFISGSDGIFKIALPAGSYLLDGVGTGAYPRTIKLPVTVEKNKFTLVTITFDSGIR